MRIRALRGPAAIRLRPRPDAGADGASVDGPQAARQEALHGNGLYRRIVETANEGIWMVDRDGRTTFVNAKVGEMLGYSADEIIGRPLFDFMDDEWREVARAKMQRRQEGQADRHEFRFRRKDGSELWALVSGSPTLDERGNFVGAMALMTDLTDRRRLERELLAAAEEERQRIGQDLHDTLGQVLTGVSFMSKGLAGRLSRELPEAAAQAEEIARLTRQATEQARALAHGLCPVAVQADGLSGALRQLAERTTEVFGIRCTHRRGRSVLMHDTVAAAHVYQIALEAVHNAIEHARCTRVWIGLRQEDDRLTLRVCDNGVGLSNAHDPHGDGLGLRTMHHRAHMIGASLDIRSTRGGGTEVICRMPPTAGQYLPHRPAGQPEGAATAQTHSVIG